MTLKEMMPSRSNGMADYANELLSAAAETPIKLYNLED